MIFSVQTIAQNTLNGTVIDKKTKETLIGASVLVVGENRGTSTDFDGKFEVTYNTLPITLEISYIGYEKTEIEILTPKPITIPLSTDKLVLDLIQVTDTRLTKKLKESPLTVEAMDITAIIEAPSATFYESIGNLKGVDLTSASLAFKIINTRGFNSTSPVRSLQIIDGVDNQSPGLNFSLGNFLGTTELDTKGVEIVVGANSALYGPNAFNGVIDMSTKDPFMFPGTSYQLKMGERSLIDRCFRYATNKKFKNDLELGFKINLQHMKANDWEANNFNPAYETDQDINNPGGYDAVNVYGDEYSTSSSLRSAPGLGVIHRRGYADSDLLDYNTNNFKFNTALHLRKNKNEFIYSFNYGNGTTIYQGDNRISLKNIKFFQNRLEFRRNDDFFIRFYTTHEDAGDSYDAVATAVELNNRFKSNEAWYTDYLNYWNNSDNISYLEEELGVEFPFSINEQAYLTYMHMLYQDEMMINGEDADVFQTWLINNQTETLSNWDNQMINIIEENPDIFTAFHDLAAAYSETPALNGAFYFPEPGTANFNQLFNEITSTTKYDEYGNLTGGTKFYDKSSLYHLQVEKKLNLNSFGNMIIGASGRLYKPDSNGSIFNDGYELNPYPIPGEFIYVGCNEDPCIEKPGVCFWTGIDEFGLPTYTDTLMQAIGYDTIQVNIRNYEFGIYLGHNKTIKAFNNQEFILNTTFRMDKNQNFDYLFSPAASIVWKPNKRDIIRTSFSSAVRNPTLTDQYFDYNQGQATLIGNLNGFGYDEYFVNIDSLYSYLRGGGASFGFNTNALNGSFIRVEPIKPEQVRTAEIGLRTTIAKKIYVDIGAYYSIYKNFIGYQIGATYNSAGEIQATQEDIDEGWAQDTTQIIANWRNVNPFSIKGYRVAANAKGRVKAQGISIGLNYYMNEKTVFNANYSWNKLVNEDDTDPLVPAYNTPEHKFNLGLSQELNILRNEYNISINYKWQEGFLFEGSPQFTGEVPSYGLVDAQINRYFNIKGLLNGEIKNSKLLIKIGASNLLNNKIYQVYGGPTIGRLAYISLTLDY